MDWSRAKTILIITFIILNIFLVAQINNTMEEKSSFVQTGNISNQQIQKLLRENHIKMKGKPEEITEANPFLAQITPFSSEWSQDEKGYYTKTFPSPAPMKNEQEVETFLLKQVPQFHAYRLQFSSAQQRTYLQHVSGMPIFDGKLIVSLTKDQRIRSIQVLHYQTKMIKKIHLIPFNNALYNLLYSDELSRFAQPTITKVILGYAARSNPNETDDYYLMPYWRFIINGSATIDVNALTGNIEQPEE